MYDQPSLFCNVPEKKLVETVNVNMMAVLMLTYTVLPQMVRRKRGIVVNLSSISGFYPLPLMAAYSASKVFVDWFSMALDVEYGSQGIIVQSLIPSYISTNLVRFSNFLSSPSFLVPDAKRFVSSALDTVTYSKRTTGFWSHGLQVSRVPSYYLRKLMYRIVESFVSIHYISVFPTVLDYGACSAMDLVHQLKADVPSDRLFKGEEVLKTFLKDIPGRMITFDIIDYSRIAQNPFEVWE